MPVPTLTPKPVVVTMSPNPDNKFTKKQAHQMKANILTQLHKSMAVRLTLTKLLPNIVDVI